MALLPLYDVDPLQGKTTPYVNYGLIAANVVVGIVVFSLPPEQYQALLNVLGLVPASELREVPRLGLFPRDLALFTAMFLHVGWLHLAGNMWFLWIFGDNIEDALGHLRYFVFYILCGLVASAVFVFSAPHLETPEVGASGAIAGVMAAYLMIRPCAKIEVLLFVWPVAIRAYWVIGVWIVLQLLSVTGTDNDGVAYWAHIGGTACGAFLIVVMRPPHIRLFECISSTKGVSEGAI
jgi:membrane associated rhomboid family serine protease